MAGAVMKDKKPIENKRNHEKQSRTSTNKVESTEALPGWPLVGLSIGSFIQVVAMDQQTCFLEVYQGSDKQGYFCFVQGSLFDAVCGELEGEEAAMEIMAWQNVRLNIKHMLSTSDIVRKIDKGLMSLLMESSRRQDEGQKLTVNEELEEATDEEQELDSEPVQAEIRRDAPHGIKETLDRALEALQKNMGNALIGTCIINKQTGKALSSYQSTLAVAHLFKALTDHVSKVFSHEASGEDLGHYYYLDLMNDQTLFVLLFDEYLWGIVFHNGTLTLGLFLNVIMPQLMKSFEEATKILEKK
jgi:hypothetical protein